MHRSKLIGFCVAAAAVALWGGCAQAQHGVEAFARLSGFSEVGGLGAGETGAIFSNGKGTLILQLAPGGLAYTLTYSGLSSGVTAAHIHFGKTHVAGGIMAFLCGGNGTPACPSAGGTVTGTLNASSVIGPTPQGVSAGDLNALISALISGTTYANVHTTNFPAGEIRGQLLVHDKNDD